jgi:hypothetical protein
MFHQRRLLTEISKAYRKKSVQLQYVKLFRPSDIYSPSANVSDVAASPDKNPGVVGIHERFARLGVIAAILRNTRIPKEVSGVVMDFL